MKKNKVLIIRFSSFGDIVQCSSIVEGLCRSIDIANIDWITRSEFVELVRLNKQVSHVYGLDRSSGILGLLKLAWSLRNVNYHYVYDAHNNLRSNLIYLVFRLSLSQARWITRSKDRWKRILLFNFGINLFPRPFKGIDSFLAPLIKNHLVDKSVNIKVDYQFDEQIKLKILNLIRGKNKTITIVPSAAWPMKRWPIAYWKELILISPELQFYILGGKEDHFCEELKLISPNRVVNLAGQLSLIESSCFIKYSDVVISADTGLLHVADVLGIKAISLMGPTAFGFTKSELISTLEINLACRPCSKDGRGNCSQATYQKCMVDITPQKVKETLNQLL